MVSSTLLLRLEVMIWRLIVEQVLFGQLIVLLAMLSVIVVVIILEGSMLLLVSGTIEIVFFTLVHWRWWRWARYALGTWTLVSVVLLWLTWHSHVILFVVEFSLEYANLLPEAFI
jgi:hypothetical protein